MKNEHISTNTRKALAIGRQVCNLAKSLKGWNLITGLYATSKAPDDIIIHTLAKEARELTLKQLHLTYKLGDTAMDGNKEQSQKLQEEILELNERLTHIADTCLAKLRATGRKEEEV